MFEVSFSQASRKVEFFPWRRLNSFFLLLSDLLRLVQWFVWASYRVKFVPSFCLSVFPLMSLAEWGSNPVFWWLGLYFCLVCCLDEASCTGCYWWLGDIGSCIQVASFVWVLNLLLSRVSSLVVWGLGVSAPTPKAQGSISAQEWRFHKWFAMALREIKTNIQKQETKDELQTNGSYKTRQIIIKIMKYTHIHIHPWTKWRQSNKNKAQ